MVSLVELVIESRTSYLMVAVFTFSAFILGLAICGVLQKFVENAESKRTGGGTAGQRASDKSGVSISLHLKMPLFSLSKFYCLKLTV